MTVTNSNKTLVPAPFTVFCERFLKPLGYTVSYVVCETESLDYSATRFELNGQRCLFRTAKQTPKKIGHFVTLWHRPTTGSDIAPFDSHDGIERVFVVVDDAPHYGVFVFDACLLMKKGIFSQANKAGKRAFRVYVPWITPVAAQAKRAQKWQCAHFVTLTDIKLGRSALRQTLLF